MIQSIRRKSKRTNQSQNWIQVLIKLTRIVIQRQGKHGALLPQRGGVAVPSQRWHRATICRCGLWSVISYLLWKSLFFCHIHKLGWPLILVAHQWSTANTDHGTMVGRGTDSYRIFITHLWLPSLCAHLHLLVSRRYFKVSFPSFSRLLFVCSSKNKFVSYRNFFIVQSRIGQTKLDDHGIEQLKLLQHNGFLKVSLQQSLSPIGAECARR